MSTHRPLVQAVHALNHEVLALESVVLEHADYETVLLDVVGPALGRLRRKLEALTKFVPEDCKIDLLEWKRKEADVELSELFCSLESGSM